MDNSITNDNNDDVEILIRNWKKIPVTKLGLPNRTFINDIKADLFNENIVYAVFDNHKYGDYKSYLFKSDNKGKTWQKIGKDLPENTILWRIVQDHIDSDLIFLGSVEIRSIFFVRSPEIASHESPRSSDLQYRSCY